MPRPGAAYERAVLDPSLDRSDSVREQICLPLSEHQHAVPKGPADCRDGLDGVLDGDIGSVGGCASASARAQQYVTNVWIGEQGGWRKSPGEEDAYQGSKQQLM